MVKRPFLEVARINPKTPQMEAFLSVGYPGMTIKIAQQIIKERRENPQSWPLEKVMEAEAFLAAYEGVPVAIDREDGFKFVER